MALSREETLSLLQKALDEGRLGHAYLISGIPGSGVKLLAKELAGLFLESGSNHVESLPDFHSIEPGSKSRRLLTEQIRELEAALHRTPEKGKRKVAVIHEADRLMPQAANAFLKTLEEPPDGSLLLLTTELPEALLETIRSRCISLVLRPGKGIPEDERSKRLRALMEEFFSEGSHTDPTAAFSLTRGFRDLLEESRVASSERLKEELSAEKSHFGKTTEIDMSEREEQLKAVAESESLQERSRLLSLVADHFGRRIRPLHDGDAPPDNDESRRLLRCLEAVERLRTSLERGVQEGLALEAGFLEIMIAANSEQGTP